MVDLDDFDALDLYDDPLVTFEVGPTLKVFHVHRNIVIRRSKVFAAAFQIDDKTGYGFKEAVERLMRFPEESLDTIKHFIHWLYSGKNSLTARISSPDDRIEATANSLIDLYVFADKYDVPALRHDVLDALIKAFSHALRIPGFRSASYAYKKTSSDSPVRKIYSMGLALRLKNSWRSSRDDVEMSILTECPELTLDLLMARTEEAPGMTLDDFIARLEALLKVVSPEQTE